VTIISGGKVFENCTRCEKLVRMSGLFGGWHSCVSDCVLAGKHLKVVEVKRGFLWLDTWLKCEVCGREEPK
jgi:hypothetical protein